MNNKFDTLQQEIDKIVAQYTQSWRGKGFDIDIQGALHDVHNKVLDIAVDLPILDKWHISTCAILELESVWRKGIKKEISTIFK